MKYCEFKPTSFDRHITLENREDWLVMPVSINRDTESCVTLSNWQVCQDMMDKDNIEYEIHNFGHWGCGWFEIIIVNPDSQDFVEKIEGLLSEYPVIDENHHSQLEMEKDDQSWDQYGYREFVRGYNDIASNETEEYIVTLLEDMSAEVLRAMFDSLDGTVEHSDYGIRYLYPDPSFTDLLDCLLSND